MSRWTTELRNIIASGIELPLNNYPIYKEEHRETLNNKIISHFMFREIGCDSVDKWLFFLERKMNEIMPLYNQRYASEDVEFNPLFNVDMTETITREIRNNATQKEVAEMIGSDRAMQLFNDTPVGEITSSEIENNTFVTNISKSNSNSNSNSNSTREGSQTETFTRKNQGSSAGLPFSKAVAQWREVMLNIDMEIIKELEILFLQIWE